jgi:DNA-binding LacI/PurR family transcriptional regulator
MRAWKGLLIIQKSSGILSAISANSHLMDEMNIADIAREAGVSRATVSRVMNGSPLVKAKTAALVRETVTRLGYVRPAVRPGPKPRAAFASRLKASSIALIAIGDTRNLFQEPIMAHIIEELQNTCRQRQMNLLLDQMSSPDQIPLCVETRQVDGAILMVSGRPAKRRDCIAKLASLLPSVHLFTPGHPLSSVDHVTVNDVAVGDMAFRSLQEAGCKSMAMVNANTEFLEALHVRGRAFTDRANEAHLPVHFFAKKENSAEPTSYWPQPLTIFDDFKTVATTIRQMPAPVGVFLTLESAAPSLHEALKAEGVLDEAHCKLLIAGATPHFVKNLEPKPTLISLSFPEIINVAVDRLLHRAQNMPAQVLTFLLPPHLTNGSSV